MIKAIVTAVLEFILELFLSIGKTLSDRKKIKEKNDELIKNLEKAETAQEQQNATDDLARDIDK